MLYSELSPRTDTNMPSPREAPSTPPAKAEPVFITLMPGTVPSASATLWTAVCCKSCAEMTLTVLAERICKVAA
jgi:hypothetical protein